MQIWQVKWSQGDTNLDHEGIGKAPTLETWKVAYQEAECLNQCVNVSGMKQNRTHYNSMLLFIFTKPTQERIKILKMTNKVHHMHYSFTLSQS